MCNGRWFPPLSDIKTLIEWNHRLFAVVVAVLVTALMVLAFVLRRRARLEPGAGSREPLAPGREAYMTFGLLETQIFLGAITVKFELPAWSVVLHFATAMLLLASLLTAALIPAGVGRGLAPSEARGRLRSVEVGRGDFVVALAFVLVILGALVANTGANRACWGFPLCDGQLWPTTDALAQLQWVHRLVAYGFTGYVIWLAVSTQRSGDRAASRAAWFLVAATGAQVVVAVTMVLQFLPTNLRAMHLAFGALVWVGAVGYAAVQRRSLPQPGVPEPATVPVSTSLSPP
jgi:heme a synthase